MKQILLAILIAACFYGCAPSGGSEAESTGSIYGVITDKATGEPIRAAGVQLNPVGTKTVTGDEGQYEFVELAPGNYTIQVTKTGYADLTGHSITVIGGKTNKGDVQLQLLPPSLRVTDNDKKDISELDFGSAEADITRSFNIFNDGVATLEWEITETSDWIIQLSKESGVLSTGATQAIVLTIDREKLATGDNTHTIHITSNNGSKQLTIKVTNNRKRATLNTLDATDISESGATFNGEIIYVGLPSYTERGFVYATSPMPTLENTIARLTAPVNSTAKYSATVTDLTLDQTDYVRAYAMNGAGTTYSSNEISFIPVIVEEFISISSLGIAVQTADINNSRINWTDANRLCENSLLGGYTDWRLPTLDELASIYLMKNEIGGFYSGFYSAFYWSSTIYKNYGTGYHCVIWFSDGYQSFERDLYSSHGYGTRQIDMYARCVRALP
jgi:hypothetical protein